MTTLHWESQTAFVISVIVQNLGYDPIARFLWLKKNNIKKVRTQTSTVNIILDDHSTVFQCNDQCAFQRWGCWIGSSGRTTKWVFFFFLIHLFNVFSKAFLCFLWKWMIKKNTEYLLSSEWVEGTFPYLCCLMLLWKVLACCWCEKHFSKAEEWKTECR